jgi:hypothetical protein
VARISIGLLAALCIFPGSARTAADGRQNAVTLWASAIAAKGGRDRLAAIRSFAIHEKTTFTRATRPDMATGKVDQIVCELPDGWWEFVDYRPGQMGYSVRVVNARTGMGWASHGGPARPLLQPDTYVPYRMRQVQYVYFLETSAVHPTPLRASRVQLGSNPVDRLEAEVEGDPVDFYLDVSSHLPVRIEVTRKITLKPPRPGMQPPEPQKFVYELDGYHDVGGIQVPARIMLGGDQTEVRVEINPEYDASIFTQPPPADAGIDSWRRRRERK